MFLFKRLLTFLLLLFSLGLSAQFASPITWEFEYERVEADVFKLIATASAEDGWAIYSQYTPDGGPVPTSFMWTEGDHFELVGKSVEEGHLKSGMDDLFGVDVMKFLSDEPVTFTQQVKVTDYSQPIELMVEFMCCDDEQCLPPTDEVYTFNLPPPGPKQGATPPPTEAEKEGRKSQLEVSKMEEMAAADEDFDQETAKTAPTTSPAPAAAPNSSNAAVLATYTAQGTPATAEDPVSWTFTAEQLAEDHYRVKMIGSLSEGWTIYSKDVDPNIGPIPTEFVVNKGAGITAVGATTESAEHLKVAYDRVWDADISKINGGEVVYQQVVAASGVEEITGFVYYQCCDDQMCFPPREVPFTLDLSGSSPVAYIDGLRGKNANITVAGPATALPANELGITVPFNPEPVGDCSIGAASTANQSLLSVFGLGLLGGLFALIMPCIFPMIPLTVSFFTKSEGTKGEGIRKASLYGFFIFLIYVLLSVPFHVLDGLNADILNTIASNVTLNVIFFLVFMFFAGSFFGFYELTLPQSWSNRASQAEGTGGIAGIFFMALTLALVSFSCTGPILGSLLVEAVSGGAWPLTAGMAGFGVALGLPFALFAAFPGFLNSMPKSGGWLNSVKVVLGFLEVALAFKFLSTADLVGDWQFLRLEPFLLVWILCFLGIAAYLFGFIRFPLDSKKKRSRSPLGIGLATLSMVFVGYLAIGLTQADDTGTYKVRRVMSGIAPPTCYNYLLPCDEERNIIPFKSLEKGLAHAREVNKPVLIDFTGKACQNCRRMEDNVWTVDRIKRYLTDEYVIVSLYVDDRTKLPESQHREVPHPNGKGRTRLIDEVGEKWQYFQQTVYAKASQPYYVLVSPDGTTLNPPVAYTPEVDDYENFLECGLNTYRSLSK